MSNVINISVPGSKSISNRVLLISALARGTSLLCGILGSDDTAHMQRALSQLGVKIKKNRQGLQVHGGNFKKTKKRLMCGNAGTAMRFLTAALASQPFNSILDGDTRMRERPIEDLLDALRQLGASAISLRGNGKPPVSVEGSLRGGTCTVNGDISSQFLSGLLMAAPLAQSKVTIKVNGELVSKPYVDLTISVMEHFGIAVKRQGYKKFETRAPQKYRAREYTIGGDASAASYFWGISALTGEKITITNISKKSLQADVAFKTLAERGALPAHIACENFPDSAMTLAVLAVFKKGQTILTGLANLRVKECDRLHALATELRKIGCTVKEMKDGLRINGNPEKLHGARIKTYNDHRMAMCFGMAGFVIPGMKIENPGCVRKTYPDFWRDLRRLKEKFQEKNIILTGMRGSGKTKLGKLLGRALGRRFIDLDDEIERRAKRPIAEIVAAKGWKYFRSLERASVVSIKRAKNAVISTGGGTLMFAPNVAILKKNGKVIYLKSSVGTLQKRLFGKTDRPSLTEADDFLKELPRIYAARRKQYERVSDAVLNISVQTKDRTHDLGKKLAALIAIVTRLGLI